MPAAIPDQAPTVPVNRWLQVVIAAVILAVLVCLAVFPNTLARRLPVQLVLAFVQMIVLGACGGLLYAIREGEIEGMRWVLKRPTPDVPGGAWYALRLGWVADVLSGAAGAVVAVSLLPSFSKEVGAAFLYLVESKGDGAVRQEPAAGPGRGKEQDEADAKTANHIGTLIAFVGVALIGGYGGRAVLKTASESMLRRKVDLVWDELAATKADERALTLAARQLNPDLPSPPRADLEAALAAASDAARVRVFDDVMSRIQAARAQEAGPRAAAVRAAVPVLDILYRHTPDDRRDRVLAALTDTLDAAKDAAPAALRDLIDRLTPAGAAAAPFVTKYNELAAQFPTPPAPPPAAGAT